MIFGITVNLTRDNAYDVTVDVLNQIKKLNCSVYMSDELSSSFQDSVITFVSGEEWIKNSDIIIAIGGDGTIIRASHYTAKYDKPILGINAGTLGFLAGIEKSELDLIEDLVLGKYSVDNRMMLCCEIYKHGQLQQKLHSLNDIVIARGHTLHMCKIDMFVDGNKTTSYIADGLIFATPTGSTAYSLSAGGPVLDPTIESIILTPICTHTIFNRSIIFNPKSVIELNVINGEEASAIVSIDGDNNISVDSDDKILIRRGGRNVKIIRMKPDNFVNVLKNKMSERRI